MKGLHRALSGLLLVGLLASCAPPPGGGSQDDIITQKVTPEGKTPITILVKNAFTINAFEQALEEKFPQVDLIQVGNYSHEMGIDEYAARMEHDDLTDIVMTWPLDVGKEYWGDRLLDLSSMPFTSRYNTSMLNKIAQDGKLFYLPGPAQVRGIVYNKTLFAENGWEVPSDYEGFVALCQEIEASGIRSIQLGFGNAEVLDTAFIGYSYGSCYSTPADAQWIDDYNSGVGSFADHFGPALDTFQDMVDAGIWKASDLQVRYSTRETMFFTRQCAMVEDSVLMTRMGYDQTGTTDEFALMPFFNPSEPSDWARLYMVCYIGLNKHLAEPENKEKYDLVMQIMDYISSPEGQEALSADTGAMYSSVKDVPPPDIEEIAALEDTLTHGRSAIFPELKNAQNALRVGLAGMLDGTLTRKDVESLVDEANQTAAAAETPEVIGTAKSDFTFVETGNFFTDAMRGAAGTDVALFLDNGKDGRYNGKGISARLYQGDITLSDLERIMPDTKLNEAGVMHIVEMTGEDLIRTLEYAITTANDSRGWFYYFSGLKMTYAPAAEPGRRIHSITGPDGKEIDPARVYTVAFMDGSYPEDAAVSVTDTGLKIIDVVAEAIRTQKTIAPSGDGRFQVAEP